MQVIKKNKRKLSDSHKVIAAISGLVFMLVALPSVAHETRIIEIGDGTQLKITAGNTPEPVLEDREYHTDLFLRHVIGGVDEDIDTGLLGGFASIDKLEIYLLMLKEDKHVDSPDDPLVAKKMKLENVEQRRGETARYGTPVRYTHDGAVGYYFTGEITTTNGTTVEVEEVFVCGGGSLAEPRDDGSVPAFGCVQDAVTFPGVKGSKDRASYKDNDKYSLNKKKHKKDD